MGALCVFNCGDGSLTADDASQCFKAGIWTVFDDFDSFAPELAQQIVQRAREQLPGSGAFAGFCCKMTLESLLWEWLPDTAGPNVIHVNVRPQWELGLRQMLEATLAREGFDGFQELAA